jgi:methylglutaconyl-CoA hydratase
VDFYCIKYTVQHRICSISLNRNDTRNTIDEVMVAELIKAFTAAQRDLTVKAILLRSEAEVFSSSIDRSYLEKIAKADFNQNLLESGELVKLFQLMYTMRKPIIAVVQGEASSTACGLLAACDFVFAARETATFGFPEMKLGYLPALAVVFMARRLGESAARSFILQGEMITGEEAYKLHLVNLLIPSIELEEKALNFIQHLIEQSSSSSMGLVKELLSRIHGMSISDSLDYAAHLNALSRMTDDCKKGIETFLSEKQQKW